MLSWQNICLSLALLALSSHSQGREYQLPDSSKRLIGESIIHEVKKGDYFQAIAEQYNVGFLSLMAANPDVDPFLPVVGTRLNVPSQLLLPYVKREGIVINLPELRLYYFPKDTNKVMVFPVGIGRQGLETPKTTSYIGEKRENPIWRPTKEMKQRYLKEKGVVLADEVPAGPNNPFGKYALRLATSVYLIHGSNQRFGIGMRASSGCIRLYDEDIKWLYENVPLNTVVRIIDQPVKMSYEAAGMKLIEVHQPLTKDGKPNQDLSTNRQLLRFSQGKDIDFEQLSKIVERPNGLVMNLIKSEQVIQSNLTD